MNFSTECDFVRACVESWTDQQDSQGTFSAQGCAIALKEKAKGAANSSYRTGRQLGIHHQANAFGENMFNSGLLLLSSAEKQSYLSRPDQNVNATDA